MTYSVILDLRQSKSLSDFSFSRSLTRRWFFATFWSSIGVLDVIEHDDRRSLLYGFQDSFLSIVKQPLNVLYEMQETYSLGRNAADVPKGESS